jgi:hypothetical protein
MEVAGNDAHQNALVTWTDVKTLHKQQNSHIQNSTQTNLDLWNTTVGYGFHFTFDILECFQSKVLHKIVDAHRLMPNTIILRDLQTPTVEEEIRPYSFHTVCISVYTQLT